LKNWLIKNQNKLAVAVVITGCLGVWGIGHNASEQIEASRPVYSQPAVQRYRPRFSGADLQYAQAEARRIMGEWSAGFTRAYMQGNTLVIWDKPLSTLEAAAYNSPVNIPPKDARSFICAEGLRDRKALDQSLFEEVSFYCAPPSTPKTSDAIQGSLWTA
jgi:hypothetical protein